MILYETINNYLINNIDDIYKKINVSAKQNVGKEENFRTDMAIVFNKIFSDLNLSSSITPEQEFSVHKGRIDTLYGYIIIEYKAPQKIKNQKSQNKNYIDQVDRQITGLASKYNCKKEKILGIIFDGVNIIYLQYKSQYLEVSNVQKITKESLTVFLFKLLSLSTEKKALIIENLLKDFSSNSDLTKEFIRELYTDYLSFLNENNISKVGLLFEQWKILFREICGYDFETLDLKIKQLNVEYDLPGKVRTDVLIYSIQTYFALIIKFLSIELLTFVSSDKSNGLSAFRIESSNELKNQLEEMESGGLFKKLGISNFLEGDFFGGYLFFWKNSLYEIIKKTILTFDNYDYGSLELEPDLARDLLKNVYHNLFPKVLRHNLGEYYTPDWLAEFLIKKMDIDYDKVTLDPTCGSGTFIVLLIKEYNQSNEQLSAKDRLKKILSCVKGYDLNPLAVISARANYLLSLGNLINERESDIEIPIYLCDSMLTILEEKKENNNCYVLSTKVGNFSIPQSVVHKGYVNQILSKLDESISMDCSAKEYAEKIKLCSFDLDENELKILEELYAEMSDLNQRGLDGIWANVIKNAFAPLFQAKVDYIIGNPPWISWQSLPEEYRESIQKYWYHYSIFDHKGLAARLGNSHDDISVLMTYVIMDNFLKDNGKLGFVINQNVFQAAGGGKGFRKFKIKNSTPIKIEEVDDFIEVEPFKDLDANNKTAVFTAIKNMEMQYPVKYNVWKKKNKGTILSSDSLTNLLNNGLKMESKFAQPIQPETLDSAWIIGNNHDLGVFRKMISKEPSCYRARKGVDTSANAIYWINEFRRENNRVVFENLPVTSKKEIKKVCKGVVESDIVYPLLRGRDIGKWRYSIPYSIILPYTEDGKVISKSKLKIEHALTYQYFFNNDFADILKNRGIYKKHFKATSNNEIPEYVVYDIGIYTFSKYKVVWKALASGMIATVVSERNNKVVIPDHNVVMIPLDNEEEAFYLAGILNSNIVSRFVKAYISWFFSTHIMDNILIPQYDSQNAIHKKIAELSKTAHLNAQNDNDTDIIERQIDNIVEKDIYGIV